MSSIRFRAAGALALAVTLAAPLLSGCARTQILDSPAPPPARPAAAASGPLIERPQVCAREGEPCGSGAECCGGLVCIGTRVSFCVTKS